MPPRGWNGAADPSVSRLNRAAGAATRCERTKRMARLDRLAREDLDGAGRESFDTIVGLRGGAGGLYSLLLHSPALAARMAATEAYVRFESPLPLALREMVILATAREMSSQYEFQAHARLARQAGVPDDTIRSLALGEDPVGASDEELAALLCVRELLQKGSISDLTFEAALQCFGPRGIAELSVVIGHYMMIALFLASLEVELAPGAVPELPLA